MLASSRQAASVVPSVGWACLWRGRHDAAPAPADITPPHHHDHRLRQRQPTEDQLPTRPRRPGRLQKHRRLAPTHRYLPTYGLCAQKQWFGSAAILRSHQKPGLDDETVVIKRWITANELPLTVMLTFILILITLTLFLTLSLTVAAPRNGRETPKQ